MRSKGYQFQELRHPAIEALQEEVGELKGIDFEVKAYPDGSWVAKSKNVEGLLTGGRNQKDIDAQLKDAIFTYYGVPPQFANDNILRNSGEPITAKKSVRVTAQVTQRGKPHEYDPKEVGKSLQEARYRS